MIVQLKNDAGHTRQVKVGFSWTAFFFQGFVYFFRGMNKHGAIYVGIILLPAVVLLASGIDGEKIDKVADAFGRGFGPIVSITLGLIMNKQEAKYYLRKGYKPVGEGWDVAAAKWRLSLNPTTSSL